MFQRDARCVSDPDPVMNNYWSFDYKHVLRAQWRATGLEPCAKLPTALVIFLARLEKVWHWVNHFACFSHILGPCRHISRRRQKKKKNSTRMVRRKGMPRQIGSLSPLQKTPPSWCVDTDHHGCIKMNSRTVDNVRYPFFFKLCRLKNIQRFGLQFITTKVSFHPPPLILVPSGLVILFYQVPCYCWIGRLYTGPKCIPSKQNTPSP